MIGDCVSVGQVQLGQWSLVLLARVTYFSNIVGEALWWRSYILLRQELVVGATPVGRLPRFQVVGCAGADSGVPERILQRPKAQEQLARADQFFDVAISDRCSCGVIRVRNKRQEFLWVHPQFEGEY